MTEEFGQVYGDLFSLMVDSVKDSVRTIMEYDASVLERAGARSLGAEGVHRLSDLYDLVDLDMTRIAPAGRADAGYVPPVMLRSDPNLAKRILFILLIS